MPSRYPLPVATTVWEPGEWITPLPFWRAKISNVFISTSCQRIPDRTAGYVWFRQKPASESGFFTRNPRWTRNHGRSLRRYPAESNDTGFHFIDVGADVHSTSPARN